MAKEENINQDVDKKRLSDLEKENAKLKKNVFKRPIGEGSPYGGGEYLKKVCSPQQKDRLRAGLEDKFKSLSLRSIFEIAQIRRSTHYSRLKNKPEALKEAKDQALVASFKQVHSEYLCWGFEMIYAHLRYQKGQLFCKKRAHKLYKQAGLSLHKTPKKPRIKREYQELLSPSQVNQGWALDFVSDMVVDQTGGLSDGKTSEWIRVINVIDECSCKDLWVEAHKSIKANKVVEILDNLLKMRGKPAYIRTDNGLEFISQELKKWAEDNGIEQKFIQLGKPT
jgi:putative transposase